MKGKKALIATAMVVVGGFKYDVQSTGEPSVAGGVGRLSL